MKPSAWAPLSSPLYWGRQRNFSNIISTGIVRSIDSLGRVVLPKELRTTYDITPDTPLEIFTDGDSIIMRKYHAQGSCVFCGDISPDAVLLHGKYVCPVCRKALGK